MSAAVCDFKGWLDNVPVVSLGGNGEFGTWQDNVPVISAGTAGGGAPIVRRRVMIF
jgi:hypothetical protein